MSRTSDTLLPRSHFSSISSSAMSNQPNDYFLEPVWSLKKSLARLWSPEPRSVNLNSAAANRRPSSAPPILRTPSSANRAVDAGPTVASEIPDNPAAHQVTIGYDQVKHHVETGDRSPNSPRLPKISFTVANKYNIEVAPSVYSPTSTTYSSNLPIDRGSASSDNDFHVLKHQSANIGTTNTDISTIVPLDAKISLAFSTMDGAEMAVAGVISSIFLPMKSISDQILQVTRLEAHHRRLFNLCNSLVLSCLVCALLKSCF